MCFNYNGAANACTSRNTMELDKKKKFIWNINAKHLKWVINAVYCCHQLSPLGFPLKETLEGASEVLRSALRCLGDGADGEDRSFM